MTPTAGGAGAMRRDVDMVVVAAGTSSRMEGRDKRVAVLAGRPLLAWTLAAVAAAPSVDRIVLVMEEGPALDVVRPFLPASVIAVVPGGTHRGASVAAGIEALARVAGAAVAADPARVILVHDGARPLVRPALVEDVAAAVRRFGAAVPVVPVPDTLRRLRDGELGETVDRSDLVAAQTPQGARSGLLRDALERFPVDGSERFTDEAALLIACTIRVHPIPGDPVNLKVTLPADLSRTEALLATQGGWRVGHGSDWHPFGPADGLRLGGVEIPAAPRLHGHSDGDVVLHAVADALLGAAGLGDLGRLHPADESTPRGVDSRILLADVVRRLADEGWEAVSVDVTIEGARPRLARHLDAMRAAVADLVRIAREAADVKASTGNLDGASGAGRGIGATAVATIGRRLPGPPPAGSDPAPRSAAAGVDA